MARARTIPSKVNTPAARRRELQSRQRVCEEEGNEGQTEKGIPGFADRQVRAWPDGTTRLPSRRRQARPRRGRPQVGSWEQALRVVLLCPCGRLAAAFGGHYGLAEGCREAVRRHDAKARDGIDPAVQRPQLAAQA